MAQVKYLSFLTRSNSEFSLPSILMLFIFLFRPEVTAWAWVATATGKTQGMVDQRKAAHSATSPSPSPLPQRPDTVPNSTEHNVLVKTEQLYSQSSFLVAVLVKPSSLFRFALMRLHRWGLTRLCAHRKFKCFHFIFSFRRLFLFCTAFQFIVYWGFYSLMVRLTCF